MKREYIIKVSTTILSMLMVILGVVSCNTVGTEVDDTTGTETESELYSTLLEQSEACIINSNGDIITVDFETQQVVYTDTKDLYMVSDMEFSTYYTLEFESILLLNNIINATLTTNGIEGITNNTLNLEVCKINSSNKLYYLWDSELEIGFILTYNF